MIEENQQMRPVHPGELLREILEEFRNLRCQGTADLECPERAERNDIAVVLADPVDGPVRAGVEDQDIPAGTAISDVSIGLGLVGLGVVQLDVV